MQGRTTKHCQRCNDIMIDVPSSKRYCDSCAVIVRKENRARENARRASLKGKGRPKGIPLTQGENGKSRKRKSMLANGKKTIKQCVREAERMGMTYGMFVALGYDKE